MRGKKLKIAIIVDQLVSGGVQKAAIEEAKEIRKLGHQITIFALIRTKSKYKYQDLTKGTKIIYLSDYNPPFFKKAARIPYFYFLTHLHLLNPFFASRYSFLKSFDFIISHGTTTCITTAAISRKFGVPYMAFVWDPMGYILEKDYKKTPLRFFLPIIKVLISNIERSFLNTAAIVATPSKVHQRALKRDYFTEAQVIYPGCFPPQEIPVKTARYVLGYSRWDLGKNPKLFIYLAKKIPSAKFLLAGSWTNPQEETYFKRLLKKNGLETRIKLLSPIKSDGLAKIAAISTFWVHPNFEAFGMAGLEMASHGLPIIIAKGSGVTELFQEGIHGFFPDEKDKSQFLKDTKYLLSNPQEAAMMGQNAANVAKNYSWENHTQIIINNIHKYLSQKKIVFLSNAFVTSRSIGGGDRFVIELAKRLPEKFHLTIITPKSGLYHFQNSGVTNHNIRFVILKKNYFDEKEYPTAIFLAYIIRAVQAYFILLKVPSFSTLHSATDFLPDIIPAALYKKKSKKTKWVARFFHFFQSPQKRKGRFLINLGTYLLQKLGLMLLQNADLIMVDNADLIPKLQKKGLDSRKIEVHGGAVEMDFYTKAIFEKKLSSDAIIISRLQEHKGVFEAIDVWAKVVSIIPNAKLIIIGYGPQPAIEKLKDKVAHFGLEKNVKFTGYVSSRQKIASFLKGSKLLLFLDHEAGFGLVVAEAMASGLPTVAYNLPIFGKTYKNGFLTAKLGDTEEIAKNVVSLLTNHNLHVNIAKSAQDEVAKFDWQQVSSKFYKSLIK